MRIIYDTLGANIMIKICITNIFFIFYAFRL